MNISPSLSIVVPTFRGQATVPHLLEQLWSESFPADVEIVLVDDGSEDGSADHIRTWLNTHDVARGTLIYIELARNFGEHNAVMAGLSAARGDLVLTLDDDLQHRPQDALRLFEALRDLPHIDIAYGQLIRKRHAAWRNVGSRATDWILGRLVGKPTGVRLSTFRCVRQRVVDEILRYEGPFPFVDGLLLQRTNRIVGVAVTHAERTSGSSGYGLPQLLRLFLNVATGFSVVPLRLSLAAGSALGLAGFLMAGYALGTYFVSGEVAGWTSIFVAVTLLSGFQLLMLGLVGEYVGRVLLTVSGRPQHSIRSRSMYSAHAADQAESLADG